MVDASPRLCHEGLPIGIPPAPREVHPSEALQLHKFSISLRRSSFVLPSFCSRRPRSSSSFPSAKARSSSVNWPYFCFSLPFTSFQLPLNCSFVMVTEFRLSDEHWSRFRKQNPIMSSEKSYRESAMALLRLWNFRRITSEK